MAYTITSNAPNKDCIQWSGLHIQYNGVSYAIADGYTNAIYTYWSYAYPTALVVTNDYPKLGQDDCLLFLNKNGTAVVVPNSTAIEGDLIVPGTILADKLAANSITAGQIAGGTITSDQIKAGAIKTVNLESRCVTSDQIDTETILTGNLHADCITTDKIVAGAVTAKQIKGETITANEIAASAIKAANIDVSDLVASTAFVNAFKANTIFTDYIESQSALVKKLDGYVGVDGGTVTIGNKKSKILLKVDNDEVTFSQQGDSGTVVNTLATFTPDALNADNVKVSDTVTIGSFLFFRRANGNLSIYKKK